MSFAELASVVGFGGDEAPIRAAIEMNDLSSELGLSSNTKKVSFQYFPERVTDTRTANYSSKEIPGGSHPIYTFVSGGERVISFDAIFCNDSNGSSSSSGLLGAALNALFGGGDSGSSIPNNDRKDVVDIAAALNFLSAMTYPIYDTQFLAHPPPIATIYLPNSGLVSADGITNSFIGILTSRTITYEKFHRNGTPRIAVVSLEFREFIQSKPTWQFVNARDLMKDGVTGSGRNYDRAIQAG